ncbi:hypothetical protein CEXT_720531 [Caerostris extrusa]|uniref:Ycf15 n=1 Tax=Caerostris extrusa TaxID=172846 RepID=A0AAV4SNA6_CAEEX|nr:hypothetical protein CEXT_720531 [Caerostris extrusa]
MTLSREHVPKRSFPFLEIEGHRKNVFKLPSAPKKACRWGRETIFFNSYVTSIIIILGQTRLVANERARWSESKSFRHFGSG